VEVLSKFDNWQLLPGYEWRHTDSGHQDTPPQSVFYT